MKICFLGSRTLQGERVKEIINIIYEKFKDSDLYFMTAGKTEGVCREVEKYAEKKAIPLILFYPDQEKFGRGKYYKRSEKMLLKSDYVVLIHDGFSKGTSNELELTKKMNIPFIYYKIEAEKENEIKLDFTVLNV